MNEQIISRDTIRARGRAAFDRGDSRDSHKMNPDALALEDWLAGFDQAAQQWHAQQHQDRRWAANELAYSLSRMSPP